MNSPIAAALDNAAGVKHKGEAKTARVFAKYAIKVIPTERLKKPDWIRVRAATSPRFHEIKAILRNHQLHTVCEEASCPNIGECFSKGTATFMIMGDICTRRCPFCDVGHGRPLPLAATLASAPAPKYNDKRAEQPVATENRRLPRPTDPTTIRLARLKRLSAPAR